MTAPQLEGPQEQPQRGVFAQVRDAVIDAAERGLAAECTPYEHIMYGALLAAVNVLPDGPERLVASLAIAAYNDAEDRRLLRIVRDGAPAYSRAAAQLLAARTGTASPRLHLVHGTEPLATPAQQGGAA